MPRAITTRRQGEGAMPRVGRQKTLPLRIAELGRPPLCIAAAIANRDPEGRQHGD